MERKQSWGYLVFTLPLCTLFFIFYIIPVVNSFYYSLFDWNGISSKMRFIGLTNYRELFQDQDYFHSLSFTFRFAFFNVLVVNVLGMLMALWANSKLRCRNFLRASVFMPNVLSAVVVGFLWSFIFIQVNTTLYEMSGWAVFSQSLLSHKGNVFWAVLIVTGWQSVGYCMVIYMAGLNSIDPSLYESASVDGATGLEKFYHITLPMIMPSVTINLFMVISSSFRNFDVNFSLTRGGPGRASMALALDIFHETFNRNRFGYGTAKAIVLLLTVMVITVLQVRYTRGKEVEHD